jgi:hypothetical protein
VHAAPDATVGIRASRAPGDAARVIGGDASMADTERTGTLREIAERLDELRRYL